MKYFKVKPQFDQMRVNGGKDFLIKNELKTQSEINKLNLTDGQRMGFTDIVLSKNKTHFIFGARFQNQCVL